jgi:hypothetical protein
MTAAAAVADEDAATTPLVSVVAVAAAAIDGAAAAASAATTGAARSWFFLKCFICKVAQGLRDVAWVNLSAPGHDVGVGPQRRQTASALWLE